MTHIEQMIQDMCPNGVEWKTLGEVCEMKRGSTITANQAEDGDIPVIAGGQKPAYFHNQSNREGKNITVQRIFNSGEKNFKSIKDAADYFGISIVAVTNNKDVIKEITKQTN